MHPIRKIGLLLPCKGAVQLILFIGTLIETTGYYMDNVVEFSPRSPKSIRKERNKMDSHVIFVIKTLID